MIAVVISGWNAAPNPSRGVNCCLSTSSIAAAVSTSPLSNVGDERVSTWNTSGSP
ncbi:unannotated protein [freshwater metagenome]|uniref:Unannotated protein n=1 Tax=freshwater metagenome TaxID=449393 RepID=A0A6J7BXP2_9ZZZZ